MFRKLRSKYGTPLLWGVLGASLFGGIGAAYGAWWYFAPEAREDYIKEQLSQPHFDSPRYVAGIVAWRYRTLDGLMGQYGFGFALLGFGVGLLAGRVREETLHPATADEVRFHLLEMLAVSSITAFLVVSLMPRQGGLVYYEDKDQFQWLMQLEFGEEPQQREAVAAVAKLLENPPFPCRSTLIPALAKAGALAEPALPILQELTKDEERPVREAAAKALGEIRTSLEESSSQESL